jgi:hypothetical protein
MVNNIPPEIADVAWANLKKMALLIDARQRGSLCAVW